VGALASRCRDLLRAQAWWRAVVAKPEWVLRFAAHLRSLAPHVDEREGSAIAGRLFIDGCKLSPEQAAEIYARDEESSDSARSPRP